MKKMFLALVISLLAVTATHAQTAARLSPEAFQAEVQKGHAVVLDVRTPEEYAKGHLANARNIDWLDDHFLANTANVDHNAQVLLYCAAGGRSEEAMQALKKAGFTNVHDMLGGYNAWKAKGLPVVKQ